jgi:DtxR family manganese transport transcriptional regulator
MNRKRPRPEGPPPDLPEEPAQAARHLRARTARASSLLEDYVELIDDLLVTGGEARAADIARRLGVSHATVSNTISRLKLAGLVHSKPYRGVFLTEAGVALAQTVRMRHRVVVDLLMAIGVPPDVAEADAEGIEHHVSAPTLKAFETFLRRLQPAAD